MGAPSREDEEAKKMEAGGDTVGQKLDAGALFVLQSKGAFVSDMSSLVSRLLASDHPLFFLSFVISFLIPLWRMSGSKHVWLAAHISVTCLCSGSIGGRIF
jgi:hypothetical protein